MGVVSPTDTPPAGAIAIVAVDASRNLCVNVKAGGGAGGTSSTFNAVFPGTGTAVGASDGTNMKPLLVDGSGNLKIAGSFAVTPAVVTACTSVQKTVGTTASLILAANASRVACSVQNSGTTRIKIRLGSNPTQTAYLRCLAAGFSADDGSSQPWDGMVSGALWKGDIYAISDSAGGTCVVSEGT